VSAYVFDYYYTADYQAAIINGVGGGLGKGNTAQKFINQATAENPPLPVGYAEIGTNDSHKATAIDYSNYNNWMRNVVVAPLLTVLANGGQLAPHAWYEQQQGLGDVDPNPPVNTPQVVITTWRYFYDQLNPSAAGSPVITTPSLPAGQVGVPYSAQLTVTGGSPGYTWALTGGQLPAGLSLDTAAGLISGTPTQAGT